ncbi:M15 family metallopeptidase [Nocardia jiangsuensis]|uniref:M15 family metallopeptidase n=1 Tax=Nocardia jiangsuensis TaxID=1691563 RepID=A0ABV8DRU3_9NOCA
MIEERGVGAGVRPDRSGAGLRRCGAVALLAAGLALAAPAAHAAPELPAAGAIDQREGIGSATGTEGLNPALALAYTLAEGEAHAEGVPLSITSGYRGPAEQQALWDDGLATYGGPDEARRWVLPPDESTHVSGDAVDVGPLEGAQWLEANGYRWGLCRTFDNEWWHFELAAAPGTACPARIPDASARN